MTRRTFLIVIGLVVLTMTLVSCGGAADMVEVTRAVKQAVVTIETVVEKEIVVQEERLSVASEPTAAPLPTATPFKPVFSVDDGTGAVASASDTADLIAAGPRVVEPLTAGEIDDNVMFDKYLNYVDRYRGPEVYLVDVSERHIVSVRDARGLPVLDAQVSAFANGQAIFGGRTTATGQVLIHPRALGVEAGTSMALRVEKEGVVDELSFVAGQSDHHIVTLDHPGRERSPVALDVLFLIDATGSMEDEIAKLKASLLQISARIDALPERPDVRFGMVTYRDRGDAYVTRVSDFTPDVGAFQAELEQVYAQGGGDDPESLNEALHRAIQDVEWRGEAVRLTFLVADAPPHLDYEQDYAYDDEMVEAVRRGIKIIPIASSGLSDQGEYIFRQLAQFTLGRFVFLTYAQAGQPGSGPGTETDHHVEPQDYTVDALDQLIVQLVTEELGALSDQEIRYLE
jgi:hypothetical protein